MAMTQEDKDGAITVYPAGYEFDGVEQLSEKEQEEKDAFELFRDQIHDSNDTATISVSKKQTDSSGRPIGKAVFDCFECGLDDYTFPQLCQRIRDDFGTGLYQIVGRNSQGHYKFKKVVGVAAPLSKDVATGGGEHANLIDRFSDAMNRQQERTEHLFRELTQGNSIGGGMAQISEMMTAMGAMMGAMGIQPQQPTPPKTMLEQMQEFALMKELIGDMGGGNGDGNLMGLLTATVQNLGPLFTAALSAGQKDGTVNEAGIIQPKTPVLENPEKEPEPVSEPTEAEQLKAMLPQLQFLYKQASGGAKPQDVAEFVIKLVPDDQLENLEAFLSDENCIAKCATVFPPIVNEYKNWLEQWQSEMLNGLAQILDDGSDVIENDEALTDTGEGEQNPVEPVAGGDGTSSIAPEPKQD